MWDVLGIPTLLQQLSMYQSALPLLAGCNAALAAAAPTYCIKVGRASVKPPNFRRHCCNVRSIDFDHLIPETSKKTA